VIKMDNVDSNEQELLSGNIRKTVWKYGIPCALITIINTLSGLILCPLIGVRGVMLEGADRGCGLCST
jgi:hypothetical protein